MTNTRTRAFISPGKYFQGPGEINRLEEFTSGFGPKVLAVIGETFYDKLSKKLPEDYAKTDSTIDVVKFDAKHLEVSHVQIDKMMKEHNFEHYDVVVGIGGGKVLDFAKAIAWGGLDTSLIILPTSVSSDAPTSAFSVIYTEEGAFEEFVFGRRNPDIVLLDTEIISKAPLRLFVAGMADALATYFEARTCRESDSPNMVETGYRKTLVASAIADLSIDVLFKQGYKAKLAVETGVLNDAVEDIIEVNTLVSGLGFESAGVAGAHGFHDGLTNIKLFTEFLHGELLSFSIMCQLALENRDYDEMDKTAKFLMDIGLPVTLAEYGYTEIKEEELRFAASKMAVSYHMKHEPFMVTEDMLYAAMLFADKMGKHFKEKYNM